MKKGFHKAGFTLVELLIAAAILLIVLSGSIAAFVQCMILNDANANLAIAINDAQYVLEEIKGLAYGDITSYYPPQFNNLNNQTVTLSKSIGTNISEVSVNVGWVERQRQRNFVLSTRIAR